MTGEPLLSAKGLARDYGPKRAVADIDLAIAAGEVLGLLGANGAGKSTILRMLAGTLAPSAGHIFIGGHSLALTPRAAKRHIGYLPERPPIYPELTVDEYLGFAARLHGIARKRRREAIAQAKEETGLTAVGKKLIGQLSKGFGQRVGIAQAIIHRPDLLILDEPTSGLDPHQLAGVRRLLGTLAVRHAVIVSSHILSEIQTVASRVLIVAGGRILLDRPLSALDDNHSWIVAGFAANPGIDALAALPGVREVRKGNAGDWWLRSAPDDDIRVALAQTAAAKGWQLNRLAPMTMTLEQRFIALTEAAGETPIAPGQAQRQR